MRHSKLIVLKFGSSASFADPFYRVRTVLQSFYNLKPNIWTKWTWLFYFGWKNQVLIKGYTRLLKIHTEFWWNGSVLTKPEQTQLNLSGTFQWTHGYSQESLWPAGWAQGLVLGENTIEIMHLKNGSPDFCMQSDVLHHPVWRCSTPSRMRWY